MENKSYLTHLLVFYPTLLNIHISLLVNSAKAAALSAMEENLDPPREVEGGADVY